MVGNILTNSILRGIQWTGDVSRPAAGQQPSVETTAAAPVDGVQVSKTSAPAAQRASVPTSVGAETAQQVAGTLVPGPNGAALSAVPAESHATNAAAPTATAASSGVPVTLQAEAPQAPAPQNPNDPQSGIRCGSFLRPDPLFTDKTQLVVHAAHAPNNPSGIVEVSTGKQKMIELSQLISGKDEVLIGFSTPKVFTVVPNDTQTGYQKLDAFPYFRHPSKVSDAGVVPSGVFIRPRNLPADALDALRTAMADQADDRTASSAHANAQLLQQAGFTSGGKNLGGKLLPYRLFKKIVDNGLEYKGQPVKFDIVSTTPATLDQHFRKVIHKEISSPIDAITGSGSATAPAPTAPTAPVGTPAPATPPAVTVKIRNSRPGVFASMLRGMMGAHVMWEALGDTGRADVDKFLPDTLKDKFHDNKPLTKGEKVKKFIFTPTKVKFLRKCIGKTFDEAGDFAPTQIANMMRIAGEGEEIKPDKDGVIKYNIVICGPKSQRGNRVVIARLETPKGTKADDILSKHVMISGYDQDVRFAGECWAERYVKPDGSEAVRIHINNNSGTYRPKPEAAKAAAEYLTAMFPGVEIVWHSTGGASTPKAVAGKPDYIKGYPVSDAQAATLPQTLDGKKVTLTDKDGHSRNYAIHRFKTVEFDMEFVDTPSRQLLNTGGLLRSRTQFKSNGDVKSVEVESKMPSTTAYQNRVKGSEFKSAEEWDTARAGVLASGSTDKAVESARTVADPSLPLESVVWKKTQRELYFVTPTFPPLVGRLNPSFLVSIDTNTVRDSANGAPKGTYTVLQPQIFTKLPWTKKITPQRIERFENLAEQLATQLNLTEATETPYAEALRHLAPPAPAAQP